MLVARNLRQLVSNGVMAAEALFAHPFSLICPNPVITQFSLIKHGETIAAEVSLHGPRQS